jgi:hypothetical protein
VSNNKVKDKKKHLIVVVPRDKGKARPQLFYRKKEGCYTTEYVVTQYIAKARRSLLASDCSHGLICRGHSASTCDNQVSHHHGKGGCISALVLLRALHLAKLFRVGGNAVRRFCARLDKEKVEQGILLGKILRKRDQNETRRGDEKAMAITMT